MSISRCFWVTVCLAVLALGCDTEGEFGVARFHLSGGYPPTESWNPAHPLAVNTAFFVEAELLDDPSTDDLALRSSDSDVLALVDVDGPDATWRAFGAVGPGEAYVELVDTTSDTVLDRYELRVRSAEDLSLDLDGDRQMPSSFAMLEQTVVAGSVCLLDGRGMWLNHYDVVDADAATDPVLEVTTAGDVLKLQAGEQGEVALLIEAEGQPAQIELDVAVVDASSVSSMMLQVDSTCGDGTASVIAEFTTEDGRAVLGVPVSWSVDGSDRFEALGDVLTVSCDDLDSIVVQAEAVGLWQSADLDPVTAMAATCSVRSAPPTPTWPLLLGVLLLALYLRATTDR